MENKFRRYCENCGKGMNEGYLFDNRITYCSDDCAKADMTYPVFSDQMKRLEDDEEYDGFYWTEWEEDDSDEDEEED